jgi:nitrilase
MVDHPDTRIDLVVLPELCPLGYSEDTFARYLPSTPETQKILEEIDLEFQAAAVRWSVAVCYGTIGRESKGIVAENGDESQSATEHSYFIRQAVIGPGGESLASYDKIHLCDYGDCAETRFFRPGSSAVSFSLNGWKFGVMVCADIRYPMLSRQLVRDHGVDVLLQPACFIRDISFRTWKSFRETRAVENGVYFAAGNYAGREFGEASLVPPWVDEDHEPQVLGTEECCLVARLDKRALNKARDELPFHRHVCSSGV